MMNAGSWTKVRPKGSARSGKGATLGRKGKKCDQALMSEAEIQRFLKTFKTVPCKRSDDHNHDHRFCKFYHTFEKDGRRDPYTQFIDIDDSSPSSKMEILYHPSIFRTTLCTDRACPFQGLCSRAHGEQNLRNRREATQLYEEAMLSLKSETSSSQNLLSMYIPKPKNYVKLCDERWKQRRIVPREFFLELYPYQLFLIRKSRSLFQHLQEVALEEGLCTITKVLRNGLIIRGHAIEATLNRVLDSFLPPSTHFYTSERAYSERVMEALSNLLLGEQKDTISDSPFVLLEPDIKKSTLRFSAVASPSQSAESLVQTVQAKIDFWIQQESYNKYAECACCMDSFNFDEGIMCSSGHFYCSKGDEGGCFGIYAQAQLSHVASTGKCLSCPNCSMEYSNKSVASVLPTALWDGLQEAFVDFQVSKNTEALSREFDERLEAKVQALLEEYGTADALLKQEAQRYALQARNTILNLSCPHCGIAYAEFTGCMALRCSTCQGDFCGYCHEKFSSGRGAHCHVRECIWNVTSNGSYYAEAGEIKRSQQAYRIRTMKHFIRKYKKDVQNAIVIELSQDLKDLGIDPAVLFEVGNIHDEMILEERCESRCLVLLVLVVTGGYFLFSTVSSRFFLE